MMPTSLNDRLVTVAAPLLKLPPAMVPLLKLPVAPPLGSSNAGVSKMPSGLISRPKLGVAAPPEVSAVTVALKLSPALMNFAPAALVAAGLASAGLAVCWMLVRLRPPGLTTNGFVDPDSALSSAPLALLLAYSVTWPTSP